MTNDDFDFRPPAPRREPRRFEPPPWEKDTFEQLREATPETVPHTPQPVGEPARVIELERAEEAANATSVETAGVAVQTGVSPQASGSDSSQLDKRIVVEMLAGLALEDPPVERSWAWVNLAAALVLGPLGGMMIVWAIAAFVGGRGAGAAALYIGAVVLLFGVGFMAGAMYLIYKAMKQRGVL